jgi:hypothetical protein
VYEESFGLQKKLPNSRKRIVEKGTKSISLIPTAAGAPWK